MSAVARIHSTRRPRSTVNHGISVAQYREIMTAIRQLPTAIRTELEHHGNVPSTALFDQMPLIPDDDADYQLPF